MVEIQVYQCSDIISYLLKLAWQLPSGMSFDHVMTTACTWTITLLYIYLYVWGLDLRLNNINYSCWYFLSSTIIISLYWTSEPPLSSSITTSEYLICDSSNLVETSCQVLLWSLLDILPRDLLLVLLLVFMTSGCHNIYI